MNTQDATIVDNQTVSVAIIGSGPAGYAAGIYTARALLEPVLFAGYEQGGQLMLTTDVENYPGFADGVAGPTLMTQMAEQTKKFGTKIIGEYVTAVDFSSRPFKLWTNFPDGVLPDDYKNADDATLQQYLEQIKTSQPNLTANSVIIATGATAVMLGVPGEKALIGRGVSTCAVCDAAFYRDKTVFVVGGGDSAMEDTLALTKFASSVTIIHRRDSFKASKIMQERVLNNPKVTVLWNSSLQEIHGDKQVSKITVSQDGQTNEHAADGVFMAIGHKPVTRQFAGQIELDSHGFIVTGQSPSRQGLEIANKALSNDGLVEYPTMTSVPGVFAAGDGVDLRYKQAITAAGQGSAAAIDCERWLDGQK
jgi:thioredoxin reductase (NADPH)